MNFFLVVLIAVSLSMDAFSLSLAYGTLGMNKRDKILLSLITGSFHFFMPLFGLFVGDIILKFIVINPDIIVFVILVFIGIEMILSSFKEEEVKQMRLPDFFLFALAVSIDSFSVGISLTEIGKNVILTPLVFALASSFFTFIGLSLGNKIERLVGKISTVVGGLILIIVGITYGF